jgi:L-fuconolactonase
MVAKFDNASCKIFGMATEADWSTWQAKDFVPNLDVVVNSFGMSRIIYGSDWPICLVVESYNKIVFIVNDYFATFSKTEQAQFFGLNAIFFYRL